MNIQLNRPQHIISLRSSSLLVAVDVRVWTATMQDKASSHELTTRKKADDAAARVTQHLLAGNATHKKLLNYRQTVYNWMQRDTYPWSGSQSILPAIRLVPFMEQYHKHEAEFNKLVDDFIDEYPGIVSNIAFRMGDFFNPNNYPSAAQVRAKFGIHLYTAEVPEGDFRNTLSQDLADDLHNNYSRQTEQMVKDIMSKQAEQLTKVMESISHCCDIEVITQADGTKKTRRRKLYDSTIQRALELCDSFGQFKLSNNQQLEDARIALQQVLADVNVDALRDSDHLRQSIKSDVDEVLKKFRSFSV